MVILLLRMLFMLSCIKLGLVDVLMIELPLFLLIRIAMLFTQRAYKMQHLVLEPTSTDCEEDAYNLTGAMA